MQIPDSNGESITPTDSGPGPLDVLEARAVLITRNALDDAEAAVRRLVAFLDRDLRPTPITVASEARRVAQAIEHALTQVATIDNLMGDNR